MAFTDKLLDDVPCLAMLRAGFRLGLWARLLRGPLPRADIPDAFLAVALDAGMVAGVAQISLTPDMAEALLTEGVGLRARAEFTALAAADLLMRGEALLADPTAFRASAATFGFFRYDRAMGTGAAQMQDTAPWVDYVGALTAREAPTLAPALPLQGVRHLLEVGGNAGGFARALLSLHPDLRVTVLDLPGVCKLGLAGDDMGGRLAFVAGDARKIDWPDADAVLFKSVLHDWTDDTAGEFLDRAAAHVGEAGRVIVCERGPIAEADIWRGAQQAGNLVFAAQYRAPDLYRGRLAAAGLRVWADWHVDLDMRFHVTCAGAGE